MRNALTIGLTALLSFTPAGQAADNWSTDPIWYDGLVEKAVYTGSRVIYGKARPFEATFLTNKEQHDRKTLTKESGSKELVEVWKHNQIELVPTPNYDYKFVATSHFTTENLTLTRLDVASQEWCGTSFKQFQLIDVNSPTPAWSFWGFSYMPEAGRIEGRLESAAVPTVPFNGLPLWLRNYDFDARPTVKFRLIPDQKSNRQTPWKPIDAEIRHAGTTAEGHKLELRAAGQLLGTYEFANDRRHVMLRYTGSDGLSYQLQSLDRVNYWTIKGE